MALRKKSTDDMMLKGRDNMWKNWISIWNDLKVLKDLIVLTTRSLIGKNVKSCYISPIKDTSINQSRSVNKNGDLTQVSLVLINSFLYKCIHSVKKYYLPMQRRHL